MFRSLWKSFTDGVNKAFQDVGLGNKVKRASGSLTAGGYWLVLTESTRNKKGAYTHSCGRKIKFKSIRLSERVPGLSLAGRSAKSRRVPFCGGCEKPPTGGTYSGGQYFISS
ncbi:hypothetical protein ACFL13_02910 [Patescibacteria group bacterium]